MPIYKARPNQNAQTLNMQQWFWGERFHANVEMRRDYAWRGSCSAEGVTEASVVSDGVGSGKWLGSCWGV